MTFSPDAVRCRFCGGKYDLMTVHVIARYADCSVWRTPCCGQQADDRGETGWKSVSDYTRISEFELRHGYAITNDGKIVR